MRSAISARHGEDSPLARFVIDRVKALGLSRTDFVRRLGYRDLTNGHRALSDFLVRGWVSPLIADNLVAALEVQQHQIEQIIGSKPLQPSGPYFRSNWPGVVAPPIVFPEEQLVLHTMTIENGPYRLAFYKSFIDADFTGTQHVTEILGSDFIAYLNRYFEGWRLLQRVEARPHRSQADGHFKLVHRVLSFETDADAATVASHLRKTTYPFDF